MLTSDGRVCVQRQKGRNVADCEMMCHGCVRALGLLCDRVGRVQRNSSLSCFLWPKVSSWTLEFDEAMIEPHTQVILTAKKVL